MGFLVAGVLLGLAVYFGVAGPLGRGIETVLSWFTGLGRYVVPVVLVSAGVAFIRQGRSSSPFRLVVGWSMVAVAALTSMPETPAIWPTSLRIAPSQWPQVIPVTWYSVVVMVASWIRGPDRPSVLLP